MSIATFHDLKGASVFITGGGSGIGAALTSGFLEQGANVAFVGRTDYGAFVDEMERRHGNRPLFMQCDVTDTDALTAAMDRAATAHGGLHVLINNAANDMRMSADDVTPAQWDEMLDINFKQYFFACQKATSLMGDKGSIINFSSISYMMGAGGMVPYVASNAGITGMTRALAREWGPRGIRVNALAPGWVLTNRQMEKWASDDALKEHMERQCLKSFMKPEDVVGTALFLASDVSAMMTSQTVVIDAGVVTTG